MKPQPDFIREFIPGAPNQPLLPLHRIVATRDLIPIGGEQMIKGSEIRKADYPIEKLLLDRWSPRAMSGEEISHEQLMRLFEAARWAPSSFNGQQWRALYARCGS